jgi:hypothetical protein
MTANRYFLVNDADPSIPRLERVPEAHLSAIKPNPAGVGLEHASTDAYES